MAEQRNSENVRTLDRGRHAQSPGEIPRRGWTDVALRVKEQIPEDKVSLVAAGLAFYALLAIFPALIAAVSLYGLFADPATVEQQLSNMVAALPSGAGELITNQLSNIADTSPTGLGWAAAASIAGALWAVSSGVQQLMRALSIAYDEDEERGFIRLRLISLALAVGLIVLGLITIGLIAAIPPILQTAGLGAGLTGLISWGRWLVLALLAVVTLSAVYKWGPNRDPAEWEWVSWGAGIATVLWLIASALFSWYVANFGNYNETYGSLGGVIVLMLWFYITGFVVMLGAEINAELEHQTAYDTTVGDDEPMGERDARMADRVADHRRR